MKLQLQLGLLLLALSLPVAAMSLNQAMASLGQAKSQGLVGEQADGYLGTVKSNSKAADIAAQINQARRAKYQQVANKNGISLKDVESIAGKKAIERTPSGQYVRIKGRWVRK